MLRTYKFYNKNKQRLAIFGEEFVGELHITIITCSLGDQFSKKKAIEGMETGCIKFGDKEECVHPKKVRVDVVGLEHKQVFMDYCHNNYYKMSEVFECTTVPYFFKVKT